MRLLITAFLILSIGVGSHAKKTDMEVSVSEQLVRTRLKSLELQVTSTYHPSIKLYIEEYVLNGFRESQKIMGTAMMYFPIFEHYLEQYNIPAEFKYLPILESRLNPTIKSPVGARGLWQFMPATGRSYGLEENKYVDERCDPYKASEAAARHLAHLYEKLGDWTLVLAAYNCGRGRVNKAIKTAGSKNFWEVRRYLPDETFQYVPKFLAAVYLGHFYNEYGIVPAYPDFDFVFARVATIHGKLSLKNLSKVTALSLEDIQKLNPAYKGNMIPASKEGHFLVLPEEAMTRFVNYSYADNKKGLSKPVALGSISKPREKICFVQKGDTLAYLAKLYNCTTADIMKWNKLDSAQLYYRQELKIYLGAET